LDFSMFFRYFWIFLKIYQNMGQKLGSNNVDDDPNVFLLLNTGNLCARVCGSSASNIGLSISTFGTSSDITSLLIITFL